MASQTAASPVSLILKVDPLAAGASVARMAARRWTRFSSGHAQLIIRTFDLTRNRKPERGITFSCDIAHAISLDGPLLSMQSGSR